MNTNQSVVGKRSEGGGIRNFIGWMIDLKGIFKFIDSKVTILHKRSQGPWSYPKYSPDSSLATGTLSSSPGVPAWDTVKWVDWCAVNKCHLRSRNDVPKVLTADTGRELIPARSGPSVGPRIWSVTYSGGLSRSWETGAELAAETGRMQTGRAVSACTRTHHWHQGVLPKGNRTGNLTGGPQVKQNQEDRERRQASARAREETIVLEKPG